MTDDQLLIPAMQASRKLGITRRTLGKHIEAGVIRSVKVGSRSFIPRSEIDRIVRGEPKAETPTEILSVEKGSEEVCQNRQNLTDKERKGAAKSPKELLDEILARYGEFLEIYNAGTAQ